MSDTTSAPSQQPASLKQVTRATRMKETALKNLFLACACVAVLAVILIFIFTFWKAIPVITQIGLGDFFSLSWAPTEGHYGILALLAGSGIVTVGSLALGVPLAVGCAVFLTEIAGKKLASVVSTAVDLLAGVRPSSTASSASSSSARSWPSSRVAWASVPSRSGSCSPS